MECEVPCPTLHKGEFMLSDGGRISDLEKKLSVGGHEGGRS